MCFMFLLSCNTGNQLEVNKDNFTKDIEQKQNLVFAFNKDLYPDSLLYKWDSTEYVTFSPQVAGSFKWNSSSELTFSPAVSFEPETEYMATINKAVLSKSKNKYSIKDKTIKFHTAALGVEQANITWSRGQNISNVMVQLDIDFNYEVDVTSASANIKLSSKGNAITANTINSGNDKRVSLQIMPVNELDEETPLDIKIEQGVVIAENGKKSATDTLIEAFIPSRFNLAINNISSQHTGEQGIVTISTSQPIVEEGLKKLIRLEPAIPFEIETTESSIIITSDKFSLTGKYELTVSKKAEGTFGGRMKEDFVEQISFKKLAPSIKFANTNGMYLSTKGNRNISLKIASVSKVKLEIIKIYENNIEQFLRRSKSYGYSYDEEEEDYNHYRYYRTDDLGDEVFSQEYDVAKLPRTGGVSLLNLDFTDKIKSFDGTYIVKVASTEESWVQESKILNFSDIGLIVKAEDNNVYVFANSIRHATAMQGVKVSFISTTNQLLDVVTTDNEGVAKITDLKNKYPGFKVGLVTAKKDGEFSFISTYKHGVETSRFDVGGRYPNATGLNAMIYAERNLYRPGEKIHASTIIRDEAWRNPGEIPVILQLEMPNGKDLTTSRKILNSEGSCEVSFDLPATTITGPYTLKVLTGNNVLLNSYTISVEDFVPDRIKSVLSLDKEEYKHGDSILATLQVDNLFGTPASGRNWQAEMNLDQTEFKAAAFADYSFDITNNADYPYGYKDGKTNDAGTAKFSFSIRKELKGTGMLQGNIMATAFDETSRPVHRYSHFKVYTQPVFIGVKNSDYYIGTRTPHKIKLVAVDKNGKAQNGVKTNVKLIKKQWHSVIQQSGNSYRYVSQKEEKVLKQGTITVSGTSTVYSFTPETSGEYEIRFSPEGSESYVSETIYAWRYGDTEYSSFEVNNEGNVTIKADKEQYNTGEDIKLLFTTPFEGRMLVTLERDHVIKHVFLSTDNKSASYTVKADDILVPNVYVTATLFRPMDDSQMPLTVAHGFKSIRVEDKAAKLPVTITSTEKSRSKTKQTIKIKTAPGAFVTIAAVDEGILQVKNFKTPDAYNYFYQKVALSTHSYDVYPFLMPEIKTRLSSTGGDGDDESSMRANPLFVNRIKNVSFWSGIKQADANGNLSYDIDIPQFSGDIRVMALAYKQKGFGCSEEHMKVADPIVISTALPRFFSPGDEALVAVTVSNTTDKEVSAGIDINVSGPLSKGNSAAQNIKIAANKEYRVVYNVNADAAIGAGKVTIAVKALNETFTHETEIAVRPAAGLQKQFTSGQVKAGNEQKIDISNNFIPASARGKLVISKSPLAEFTKDITDLVRYPYGCVEQTTSTAFPQLYYKELVKSIAQTESNDMNPGYNVREAILKLQSMQMSNGALTYWPSGGYESWWGTIYAAHFLFEAKKAGYPVNSKTLDKIEGYLVQMLKAKKTTVLYYNLNEKKEIASKEVAYSLFVLALAGKPQYSTMNYYKAHPEMLSIDSKYLLGAAYALSGQKQKVAEIIPDKFAGEESKTTFGGSFYSYIRDLAISLYALQEINPEHPQVPVLARMLSEKMRSTRYMNTQEKAFGILAMGKIAARANKTKANATLTANGKNIGNSNGEDISVNLEKYMGQAIKLKVSGTGSYYYFAETSGITADGSYKEEDSYLRARRSFYTRSGRQITDNTFKQNDLIVVQLTLEAQYNTEVENVVLTDILPAGLEIENTRLNDMPEVDWLKFWSKADYIDFRDDRVNLFTSADASKKIFYYMVRAVSPGTYKMGPVQADAMYNGEFHSYHGAGTIKVLQN